MELRHDTLFANCKLSMLQQRFVCLELCGREIRPDEAYDAGGSLIVWLAQMLHNQSFLDDMQWRLLMKECSGYVAEAAPAIEDHLVRRVPYPEDWKWPQLAFADGRYASWPSVAVSGYLDLESGEWIESIRPPIITVSYHLDALMFAELRRCKDLEKRNASTDALTETQGT